MAIILDMTKIQGPAPGTFEANILRSTAVPYQEIDVSGGQYPLPSPTNYPPPSRPVVIKLEGLSVFPSFANKVDPITIDGSRKAGTNDTQV